MPLLQIPFRNFVKLWTHTVATAKSLIVGRCANWFARSSSHPPRLRGLLVNDAIVKEIGGFYEAFFGAHERVLMLNA